MCEICGDDTDHRESWTSDMLRALELIQELYSTRDGIIGGPLHVQLDDLNLSDDASYNHLPVDYGRGGHGEWEDEAAMRRICDELLPLLMRIPEEQRIGTVVAFHRAHYCG